MTSEEATSFVSTYITAMNSHNVDALGSLYTDDAVVVSPTFGQVFGRNAIEQSYRQMFSVVFPEFAIDTDISQMIVDRRRIVLFTTVQFTNTVSLFAVPASGARVDIRTVVLVMTFRGVQVVHESRMWDSLSLHHVLDKLQLERELRAAAEIQKALLPLKTIASSWFDVAGASIPCRTIGGDFFEHFELPPSSVGIAIGDVSGKGPPAALLTSLVQGIFASEVQSGRGPADVMIRINQLLLKRGIEARFATFFYAVLARDGRLTYSNAGHNPPILRSSNRARRLVAGGTVLGLFRDAEFTEETVELCPGDMIACFTDGVTEAMNDSGDEFGEDRLLECLDHSAVSDDSLAITRLVFESVRQFCAETPQSDDITMLVLRYAASPVGETVSVRSLS
jgi:hypothetical protein